MSKESDKRRYALLVLLILLSLILRLNDLGKESLWLDEIYGTLLTAKQPIDYLLNPHINLPVSTYHIILHYWMQIFGQSEFSIRFPALIFGVLSIFVIYKVGKEIFNQEVGFLSALMLAISPFHLHYSQEARPYSLLMLLSLVSIYYFIRFLKSGNKKDGIVYTLSTLIGIYTHYFIFFLLIFQNIYFFIYNIKNKKLVKIWIISQGIVALIFLGYNPHFLGQIMWGLNGGLAHLAPYFSLFSIIKTFYVFILGFSFINSDYCIPCFYVNPFIIFLICGGFLLLTFLGIKNLFVYKKNFKEWKYKNEKLIFLILYLLMPILIIYTISFNTSLFQTRYVLYSSAPLYILISRGISGFQKRIKLVFVVLLLFLSSFVLGGYYSDVTKEQWRETSSYINQYSKGNDVLVFPYLTFVFEYYEVRIDKKILLPDDYDSPKSPHEVYGEHLKPRDIDKITSDYNRVWLVLPPTWELKDYEEVIKEFKTLILEKEFKEVKIYLFEI